MKIAGQRSCLLSQISSKTQRRDVTFNITKVQATKADLSNKLLFRFFHSNDLLLQLCIFCRNLSKNIKNFNVVNRSA